MSDNRDNLIPDYGEFDLAAALDAYRKSTAADAAAEALEKAIRAKTQDSSAPRPETSEERQESIADRSRRIVMDALGDTLRQYQRSGASGTEPEPAQPPQPVRERDRKPEPVEVPKPAVKDDASGQESARAAKPPQADVRRPEPVEVPKPVVKDDAREPVPAGEPAPVQEGVRKPEPVEVRKPVQADDRKPEPAGRPEAVPENDRRQEPARAPKAADGTAASPEDALSDPWDMLQAARQRRAAEREPEPEPEPEPREPLSQRISEGFSSFADRFLTPVIRMAATRIAQRQQQRAEAANWPEPVDIRETRELSPAKAGKYYLSMLKSLRLRCRISAALCVLLAWINLGLPMTGMLRVSLPLEAGVSVILTLAVMVAALDVVTAGLRQLADLQPGAEALAALAVIFSCVDGLLILFGIGDNLPFCAIGAVALTFALWGERLTCTALLRTFRTASSSKMASVLTSEVLTEQGDEGLMRTDRGSTEGIVRRSESQDLCRSAYAAAAPFLLAAALLLSIAASLGGQGNYFLHTLSALLSVSASFAAFISFSLPYAIASRQLRSTGAALAGYEGCAGIGRTRRIVVNDEDLFPPGTMRFSEINVQEGVFLGKVVSSTASLLIASGSGVSSLFRELVERRGYHVPNVDQFLIHEGGGLSGIVGGEKILVGSAGFMNLMGIRLPQNLQSRNAICTAISDELVGVFVIEYIPVTSVQEALVTLLRGRTQTVFAIRDFNITPLMIRNLFRMPTENFNFPSFRDRYRIGEDITDAASPVNAVLTRSGMLPMVEAAEAGRKLYNTCRLSTILSLIGTGIGMIIMFLLCRAGSFDTASVGNVLSFMFLWALPVLILSVGQNRR